MIQVVFALGWLACVALGGWALFSHRHVARFDYRLDVADAARFNAMAPLAWAAAMAWLIFACYTNHGGTVVLQLQTRRGRLRTPG